MADSITVDDAASADVVYTEIVSNDLGVREFRPNGELLENLRRIRFSSVLNKTNKPAVERRRLYISKNVQDSESGVVHTMSLTLDIVIPPTSAASLTLFKDMVSCLTDILTYSAWANVAPIISGTCPTGDFSD